MNLKLSRLAAAAAFLATCATASAAPVSIDGVIGAEWNGVSAVTVAHDPQAATGNFQAPGNTTAGASYSIKVRDDGAYYYVALEVTGNADKSLGNLANLYFDTNSQTSPGSDIGIELTNNRFFIPGVPAAGFFDSTPFVTYNVSNAGVIELAILNSFFSGGVVGNAAFPGAAADVVLRLSQSFGYSVAGGATYGDDRLGRAALAAAAVPEPASLALLGIGLLGMAARRKRSNKTA